MSEYIQKGFNPLQYEDELKRLVGEYKKLTGRPLFVFATNFRPGPADISLSMEDYYVFVDMLKDLTDDDIDVYLETPGGSGEAAEVIVRFLRSKFKKVNFLISGESKSAGTLIALSGDEIMMTQTGCLGPIDAQVKIGRTVVSAYDYIEWMEEKQKEANEKKSLNSADAIMIAQINPGELKGVDNALNYAKDLVCEWLPKYKFKDWDETETSKTKVTTAMKKSRAAEIVEELVNHSKWRSHGRPLKIEDLKKIGLKIVEVDDDKTLGDLVYRIQTVIRLIFLGPPYKIFATESEKLFKNATPPPGQMIPGMMQMPPQGPDTVEIDINCQKCNRNHKVVAKLIPSGATGPKAPTSFPVNDIIICTCGEKINIKKIRDDIEKGTGKKVI